MQSLFCKGASCDANRPPSACVKQFRQILLWPLRLMPVRGSEHEHAKPWKLLADMGDASPWREVVDEYGGEHGHFHERHYNEFRLFCLSFSAFCMVKAKASKTPRWLTRQ